jgi:hypothetical protein
VLRTAAATRAQHAAWLGPLSGSSRPLDRALVWAHPQVHESPFFPFTGSAADAFVAIRSSRYGLCGLSEEGAVHCRDDFPIDYASSPTSSPLRLSAAAPATTPPTRLVGGGGAWIAWLSGASTLHGWTSAEAFEDPVPVEASAIEAIATDGETFTVLDHDGDVHAPRSMTGNDIGDTITACLAAPVILQRV